MEKLSEIRFFKTLSDKDLKEVAPYVVTEKHAKRATIFSEGDPADWFYVVTEGKVKITKLSQDGKEIILEIIPPMEIFGGLAVIKGIPYPANAVAMEDSVSIRIARTNLLKILDRFPEVMMNLLVALSSRLKDSHETTRNIALEKVGSRIAALLLKLSEQAGTRTKEGIELNIKLTKQDIAEMVGTTVETSIRTMSKFKKMGLINERAGKIIIKNPEAMRNV